MAIAAQASSPALRRVALSYDDRLRVETLSAPGGNVTTFAYQPPDQNGERVTTVWLERDLSIVDVRSTNDGKPAAQIGSAPDQWTRTALAMARTLHLDYAVIDAIPVGDELHVLEVNANGVWWFLPNDVGAELEIRFHEWLEGEVTQAELRHSPIDAAVNFFRGVERERALSALKAMGTRLVSKIVIPRRSQADQIGDRSAAGNET